MRLWHRIMANVWMHNGHLQVEGAKMSKSDGNFVTIHQLLQDWNGYGWPGDAIRFNMLHSQYRQPMDWTYENLDNSHKTLWEWYGNLTDIPVSESLPDALFIETRKDDLNTPGGSPNFIKWCKRSSIRSFWQAFDF